MKKKILLALALSMLLGVRVDAVEVSSYTELQQAIVAGTTPINVVKNITDTGALGTISSDITISGNGVTIDGNGNNGLTISSGSPIIDGTINFINFEKELGGAIYNKGTITSINGTFSGNKATSTSGGGVGGAIYNYSTSTITSINGTFTNNNAVASGGAIANDGSINSINGTFSDNITNETGGAISNTYGGKITSINGSFKSNTAQQGGGAIYNFYNGTINSLQGTFTNNKATNGDGGAIFNSKDAEITSINGTFDSNEATNNGGAIYNYNSATINSLQGNFTNNTANNYGGAIYNDSTLTSISGTFGNNDKNSGNTANYGGAIYNGGTITSINGNFTNNKVNNHGGAIQNNGTITSINGTFDSNEATNNGGAINSNMGTITSINGTFKGNSAKYGGAISNYKKISSLQGTFADNKAEESGGVIYNGGTITSINGNFTNNKANNHGGAIYNSSTITSINGTFTDNKATNSDGGAIKNNGSINSINGTFTGNKAEKSGGTIYNASTIGSITGNFTNNTATNGVGGAIENEKGIIESLQGTFINNKAIKGGAICNFARINIVAQTVDTIISGNKAIGGAGAGDGIYNNGTINLNAGGYSIKISDNIDGSGTINVNNTVDSLPTYGVVVLDNSMIANNNINLYNGTLRLVDANLGESNTLTLNGGILDTIDSEIRNTKLGKISGTGTDFAFDVNLEGNTEADKFTLADGSSATINISEMNLLKNVYPQGGPDSIKIFDGATDKLTINDYTVFDKDTKIIFTQSLSDKGELNFTGTAGTYGLKDAVAYTDGNRQYDIWGTETLSSGLDSMGGANSKLVIKGTSPGDNIVDGNDFTGITVKSGQTLSIKNVEVKNFENISNYGGAIKNEGNLTISNSKFSYNNAQQGGAISNEGTINSIINGNFNNNEASNGSGGAIFNAMHKTINFINGTFTDNKATYDGGAIYNSTDSSIIKSIQGTFIGNKAENSGGAIFNRSGGTINSINGSFTGNIASTKGGAIANVGTIDSLQGTFTGNEVTSSAGDAFGGAIYNANNKTINYINGIFTDNIATNYGGAIYNGTDSIIKSIQGTFTGNKGSQGGAIDNNGTIDSVQGNFIKNESESAAGGAINNLKIINFINGSFIENEAKDSGGAIANWGTIDSINGSFESNKALTINGGAIVNCGSSTINSINGSFTNNIAGEKGGAIVNEGTIDSLQGNFTGNTATNDTGSDTLGGAIYNWGSINSLQGTLKDNSAQNGGAIYNKEKITSINTTFDNNTAKNGGAIYNLDSISSLQGTFTNNTAEDVGGAISNLGTINIVADTQDTTFTGNTANNTSNALYNGNDSTINLNAGNHKIVFNDGISGSNGSIININADNSKTSADLPTYGTVAINNEVTNNTINMYNGTLSLGTNTQNGVSYSGTFADNVEFNYNGGTVSLQNGGINSANLGQLVLNSDMDLKLDANIAAQKMDTITVNDFNANSHNINISNLSIINPIEKKSFSLSPIGEMSDTALRSALASAIRYTGNSNLVTPIYKYHAEYDPNTALMNFTLTGGGGASDFNPAVLAAPVATQIGGYLTQLNVYEQAFSNQDMLMSLTSEQRTALKFANKLASAQGTGMGGVVTFSPNQIPEQEKGLWFRPFASFENVGLSGGPNVKNIGYGTLVGGDTELIELKRGWNAVYSGYVGYNGSNQNYDGVSIYQNGGTLGLSGLWYKGNFFTGLTANVGASAGQANTMYGSDDFAMLSTGIASKTGYNFELANGKFIIQPNYLMSYTFVNTFDYTNSANVRISSDPLHAIQIAPGVKFIGNLKNGWQPYISLQMVWNIIDSTRFNANNVSLPNMSVDPYFQYGLGIQKRVGDRFTGFGQAMLRNGGRNGIALSFGFRWALGK